MNDLIEKISACIAENRSEINIPPILHQAIVANLIVDTHSIVMPRDHIYGVYKIRAYIKKEQGNIQPIGIEDAVENIGKCDFEDIRVTGLSMTDKTFMIFSDKEVHSILGVLYGYKVTS
jgi:hypothetical protein